MTPHTFYRIALWVPLAVPAVVAIFFNDPWLRPSSGILFKAGQVLLMSGVYGGIPYAALAIWATWWIGRLDEPGIRRLALRAPLLMLAVWIPIVVAVGLVVGEPLLFLRVAALGAAFIIPIGYAYVALVLAVRKLVAPGIGDPRRASTHASVPLHR